jgi:hypothetical protein
MVGVIGLYEPSTAAAASPPSTGTAQPLVEELFVDSADRPLCEAIGSLMREESDWTNAFLDKGADSPERSAAVPKYKVESVKWAERIQTLLNQHADPPRYLTRTLQQYIDGVLLYSENLYEDRGTDPFDKVTYDSAVVALGGPLATCYKVGVRW